MQKVVVKGLIGFIFKEDLFPVPVELLNKILQSLRTPGADGAVIDPEHPQRHIPRHLALSKDGIDNVK